MEVVLEIPGRWEAPPPAEGVELEQIAPDPELLHEYQRESGGELTDADLAAIGAHSRILRIRTAAGSVDAARLLLATAARLLEAGGAAVRVTTSGLVFTAREWIELAHRDTPDALFHAFVRIEGNEATAWSRGMHTFGLKDGFLELAAGHSSPTMVLKMFLTFYLRFPGDVREDDMFSCIPPYGDQLYRLAADDARGSRGTAYNPYGRWVLRAAGATRVDGLTDVVAISAGGQSLAVLADGSVRVWGANHANPSAASSPLHRAPSVLEGLTDAAVAVSAGGRHSLVLLAGGGVMAFGDNREGQLGADVAASSVAVPVAVPTDVVAVSAGYSHNLALGRDGSVWAWGSHVHGELGDGRPGQPRPGPAPVVGLDQPAIAVSAGFSQSVALLADGSVAHWGIVGGEDGGAQEWHLAPTALDLPGPARAVAVSSHLLVLMVDGSVWACGSNSVGQLGDGTRTGRRTAAPVSELSAHATAVAAGGSHSLALLDDGRVMVWGWPFGRPTPVEVEGVVAVAAGQGYSLALQRGGSVMAWGSNLFGQLGLRRHHEGPSLGEIEPPPLTSRSLAALEALGALSVRLRGVPAEAAPLGGTKLGGCPDLPPDVPWPVHDGAPQTFVGQVDQAEVANAMRGVQPGAEGSGLLLFFCDSEFRVGGDSYDELPCRVLLVPPGTELVRRAHPDELAEQWRFTEVPLRPEPEWIDVPVEAWEVDSLALRGEQLWAWANRRDERDDAPRHRMFGYPEPVQNDPRRWSDEVLLLQVDADDDVGVDWGDCGRLFYLARASDLVASRLERVRLVYQCH